MDKKATRIIGWYQQRLADAQLAQAVAEADAAEAREELAQTRAVLDEQRSESEQNPAGGEQAGGEPQT